MCFSTKRKRKSRLYEICIKYGIPITYPSLFEDDTLYYLWGISKNGIGLIGTIIMGKSLINFMILKNI